VTERHGRPRGELAVLDVEIGAADARGRDLQHDVTRSCAWLRPLREPDVTAPRLELRDAEHG
jgi:hypothetical protein